MASSPQKPAREPGTDRSPAAPEGTSPVTPLISDSQPPDLREDACLPSLLPGLRGLVTAGTLATGSAGGSAQSRAEPGCL